MLSKLLEDNEAHELKMKIIFFLKKEDIVWKPTVYGCVVGVEVVIRR